MRGLRRTVRTEGEISIGEVASSVIRLCDVCALCDTRNERDALGPGYGVRGAYRAKGQARRRCSLFESCERGGAGEIRTRDNRFRNWHRRSWL
jgi:hypothetical protein